VSLHKNKGLEELIAHCHLKIMGKADGEEKKARLRKN
jgi:hypothetical protein